MRILVVFSHPSTESLGFALFNRTVETLKAQGHDVQSLDLYRMGFNPVLSTEEWNTYLSDTEQNIAAVRDHVEKLQWAEGLVFVFPTYYYGLPAMLKGWFERVWLPGITFEVAAANNQRPIAKMQDKKLIAVVTTSGSPKWWIFLIRDPVRSFFKRGLRPLFGRKCRYVWCQLYNMNHVDRAAGTRFLDHVEKRMKSI
ncbi:NAD(P)H-dependent oxidoreductase [Sulfitobacter sp. F26169L]|uniref:NAD(P)H-dependent oxidoreductase n=1 Tax=Sulfitobacter sp. F26169L TaxID=2996015 RepID=UPI002260DCE0|nr:NAD(P)H-dependent oxidoreductase [Sulfitobacter sp. F26169L]MCX7568118.1 NAD(P)H-dependent oxidoreductase [Sulfitobacter sp. F26169L]